MGTLLIIRHAQASFLAENYDQLSTLGQTQAHLLGRFWAANNLRFDRVACGPRERQQNTAQLVAEAYATCNHTFPETEIYPEFDEYQAEAIMQAGLPILLESFPQIRALNAAFSLAVEPDTRRLTFQRLFESVIAHWVCGELQLNSVESWPAFCARVNSGIDRILATQQRSERIAVFTSAGPMALALQRALTISPEKTLQMSWMPRNSSWSEFLYSKNKFTLSSFNTHPHLDDPAHLTYR